MKIALRKISGVIAAMSLAGGSTAAMASRPSAIAAPSVGVANPWTALSMMTASSTYDVRDYDHDHARGPLPLLALAVILATIAVGIAIALQKADDDAGGISIRPVSPS